MTWVQGEANTILTGCEQGRILAHDIRSPSPIWSIATTKNIGVCSLASLGASGNIVVGCMGGTVSLLDPRTGRLFYSNQLHGDDIRSMASITDSSKNCFATSSYDGTAALWQLGFNSAESSSTVVEKIGDLSGGHTDKLLSISMSLDINEKIVVVTSGADGNVVLWRQNTNYI